MRIDCKNVTKMASRILYMPNAAHSSNKFTNSNSFQSSNNSLMISSTSSNSSTFSNGSNTNSILNDSSSELISKNSSIFNNNAISTSSFVNQNSGSLKLAKWNIGLMNLEGKYLTAENFGCKINATGNTLRKKQKWFIEHDVIDEFVYLISPLGYYLATDKYGKVTCEKLSPEDDCKFHLETNTEGKWSFRSDMYGYYFGGTGDRLHCFSKIPEWWTVHLAIHPQVFIFVFPFKYLFALAPNIYMTKLP